MLHDDSQETLKARGNELQQRYELQSSFLLILNYSFYGLDSGRFPPRGSELFSKRPGPRLQFSGLRFCADPTTRRVQQN